MNSNKVERARELRARQTKAESLLWTVLRAKQMCGLKFRRQHFVAPYFGDFACTSKMVIVELDGGYHDHREKEDVTRQRYLEALGWTVLRFSNEVVLQDVSAVAISIAKQLELSAEFTKRKGGVTGMLSAKKQSSPVQKPSPGPESPTSPASGQR